MSHIRPIHSAERKNFQTLVDAIKSDHACLMSVFDTTTSKTAVLVCAVSHVASDAEPFEFVPLAILCDGDPYARFIPPTAIDPLPPPTLEVS